MKTWFSLNLIEKLGCKHEDAGEFREALEIWLYGLQLAKKVYKIDHVNVASMHIRVSNCMLQLGDLPNAIINTIVAVGILERTKGKDHPKTGTVYLNLALMQSRYGNYENALDSCQKSIKTLTVAYGKNHYEVGKAHRMMAMILGFSHDWSSAIKHWRKTRDIFTQCLERSNSEIGDTYYFEATSYYEIGRLSEAKFSLNKAIEIYNECKNLESLISCYNDLGVLHLVTGEYEEAIKFLKSKLIGEIHDNGIKCRLLNNLALAYRMLHKPKQALAISLKALNLCEKITGFNDIKAGFSHSVVARSYIELQDWDKVILHSNKALKIYKLKACPDKPKHISVLSNLAIAYYHLKKYNRSKEILEEAISIIENSEFEIEPTLKIGIFNDYGSVNFQLGNNHLAYKWIKQALDIGSSTVGLLNTSVAKIFLNLAQLFKKTGNYYDANKMCKNAFRGLLKDRKKAFNVLSSLSRRNFTNYTAEYFSTWINLLNEKNMNEVKEAYKVWMQIKGAATELEMNIQLAFDKVDEDEKAKIRDYKKCLNEFSQLRLITFENSEDERKRKKSLKILNERINELEVRFGRFLLSVPNPMINVDVDPENIFSILNENELFLDFGHIDDEMFFFAVSNHGTIQYKKIKNATLLIKKIKILNKLIRIADPNALDECKNLYNLLIKPFSGIFQNIKYLVLSPDAELHLLPWEILYDGNQFLVEKFDSFRYVFSAREILKGKKQKKKERSTNSAVVFGNPDFSFVPKTKANSISCSGYISKLNSSSFFKSVKIMEIPETGIEAEKIAFLLGPSTELFQGKNATEKNLMNLKSPEVLHIATHGLFLKTDELESDPLLQSFIFLAGANVGLYKDGKTGIMSALEVSTVNLKETELVVLSLCQSAEGIIYSVEGVINMCYAILIAGARSVISSLWQIPNQDTMELLLRMYKNCKAGATVPEALVNAKREMSKKLHPYYWGSLIYHGEKTKILR